MNKIKNIITILAILMFTVLPVFAATDLPADYKLKSYTFSTEIVGLGTVEVHSDDKGTQILSKIESNEYTEFNYVRYTAYPATGYHFVDYTYDDKTTTLPNMGFKLLSKDMSITITFEADSPSSTPPTENRDVEIRSDPSGAEIRDNTGSLGTTPLKIQISEGLTKELSIKMEGYREQNFKVNYNTLIQNIVLIPMAMPTPTPVPDSRTNFNVIIDTVPTDAFVSIVGGYEGYTPMTIEIPESESKKLTITKDGYKPLETIIRYNDVSTNFTLELLVNPTPTPSVTPTSTPTPIPTPNVTVPPTPIPTPTPRLAYEENQKFMEDRSMSGSDYGNLNISANQPNSSIFLNGKYIASTKENGTSIKANTGSNNITVTKEGYENWTRIATVKYASTNYILADLIPITETLPVVTSETKKEDSPVVAPVSENKDKGSSTPMYIFGLVIVAITFFSLAWFKESIMRYAGIISKNVKATKTELSESK